MADVTIPADRKKPYPDQIQSGRFESNNLPSIENYNRELFRVRASRWVELLPDELVIQEKTVSIVRNQFLVSYVETIPVKDIGRIVHIDTLFFASIQVLGKNPDHELSIKGLYKTQAQTAKSILDGLLLEQTGEIDIPKGLPVEARREILAQSGIYADHRQRDAE
jgi:hypothetical protein